MSYRHSSHHKGYTNTRDGERSQQPERSFQHPRKDDDTNYDHVTMDMSEESNNNNSDNDSPRDVRRRSSQSSGERDFFRGTESPPGDRGRPKSREHNFDNNRDDCGYTRQSGDNFKSKYYENNEFSSKEHSNDHYNSASSSGEKSNERQTYDEYRDQPKKLSSSDKSHGDDTHSRVSPVNDDGGKYNSYKGSDKETPKRYDQDNFDRKDREKKDKDSDRGRRYEGERNRHNTYHKDKFDKKYSNDKRSSNDDRRKDRSRSRDKSSGSYKRRSHSGDRDRSRSYYHRSEGSGRSDSRERRSFKRSRSRDRSPTSNFEYKPSYKVSKKLQALDKMGLQIKTPDGSMATAQMLLKQTFAEQVEKVKNDTGIELPKYYNPAAMNPLKYANQIQKRKLLWGNKGKEAEASSTSEAIANEPNKSSASNKWQGTKFAQDTDGKVASKFMRLMGIKDPNVAQGSSSSSSGDIVKKQEEMFEAMQAQYEVARATTHTMRGVGLGFSSHAKPF